MKPRNRRILFQSLVALGTSVVSVASTGCSKMTPSIEKISNTERKDREARAEAERDAKAKEAEAERARALDVARAAVEAAKDKKVVAITPLEIRVHSKADLANSKKEWAATELDGAREIVELAETDRESLTSADGAVSVELERKLPATYSAILHVFVEKDSVVKSLAAAEMRGTFEAVTRPARADAIEKTAYSIRLEGASAIDAATLRAVVNAAIVFEVR